MRGDEYQQKAQETNEVKVIEVSCLIQQKEIREAEEKQRHAEPVPKTNANKDCQRG